MLEIGQGTLLLRLPGVAIEIAYYEARGRASTCVDAPVHVGGQPALVPQTRFQLPA